MYSEFCSIRDDSCASCENNDDDDNDDDDDGVRLS